MHIPHAWVSGVRRVNLAGRIGGNGVRVGAVATVASWESGQAPTYVTSCIRRGKFGDRVPKAHDVKARVSLKLPNSLKRPAEDFSAKDEVSVNQYVALTLA